MCLSLIQDNVSLYSSYFIKREEEDTKIDIIVPTKRIPNWIERNKSSTTYRERHVSTGDDSNKDSELANETQSPGMKVHSLDLGIMTSDIESFITNEPDSDNEEDGNDEDSIEEDESSSSSSSNSSETNDDDEDGPEEEVDNDENDNSY